MRIFGTNTIRLAFTIVACLAVLFPARRFAYGQDAGAEAPTGTEATTPPVAGTGLSLTLKYDTAAHPIPGGGNIAVDGQGNLYVTNYGADGHTFQIDKYGTDGEYILSWGSAGADQGQFQWRGGRDGGYLASDKEGNVYVGDLVNLRVQKFDSSGNFLLMWDMESYIDAQFGPRVVGNVAVDTLGNVYVGSIPKVLVFDPDGNFLMNIGSFGAEDGQCNRCLGTPDNQGHVYIADHDNYRIDKFDTRGNFLLKWGHVGTGDGEFQGPRFAVPDNNGNIFVADESARLQEFDGTGTFLAKWTDPGNGDGPFELVQSVAVDQNDNVYVAAYRKSDGISMYKFQEN